MLRGSNKHSGSCAQVSALDMTTPNQATECTAGMLLTIDWHAVAAAESAALEGSKHCLSAIRAPCFVG
jgi:hypothetical protein